MVLVLQSQLWMVHSLVVRAHGLEYGGREFEFRNRHLQPEIKLRGERELYYGQKLPQTVSLTHAISVKTETTEPTTVLPPWRRTGSNAVLPHGSRDS